MSKVGGIPEFVFLEVFDKQGNSGNRILTNNPDYDVTPEEVKLNPASILAVYSHVGNWIYRDIKEVKETDPVKCPRYYSRGFQSIGYSVSPYFSYDTVKIRLKYRKVGKVHDCPMCGCKQESEEIVEEMEISTLERPKDKVLTSIIQE